MSDKEKMTGLEKFTRKNKDFEGQSSFKYGGRIQIAKPSSHAEDKDAETDKHSPAVQENISPAAEADGQTAAPVSETMKREPSSPAASSEAETKRGKGRPKISEEEKKNKVVINFQVSRNLKMKIEELRLKTYRNSVTDVMIEAINDVLRKYGME